jgi:hypothetical protein
MTPAFRRFGLFTLFIALTAVVITAIKIDRSVLSYEQVVHRDFGTPERITAVVALFERIEKTPRADLPLVKNNPQQFGFPETRLIRRPEIPKELAENLWGIHPHPDSPAYASFLSVLAHYDEQHQLRAIEFYGSRYGAFVSRDPALKPVMWGELQQLAGAPVFITARITGEPG